MLHLIPSQITEAVNILNQGGVLIFPTETSYGLGCDATNDAAVARIFALKGRPDGKGLPLLIAEAGDAERYVAFGEKAKELGLLHWPGALNIVAPITVTSPVSSRCSEGGNQSVRVSSHPVASALARALGRPLVATSANVSGSEPLYDVVGVEDVFKDRSNEPDAVIDAGVLERRPASTTVVVIGENVTIVREGSVHIDV